VSVKAFAFFEFSLMPLEFYPMPRCFRLWVVLSFMGSAQPLMAAVDERQVAALVDAALAAWSVPGAAVVIVENDQVVYLRGHGLRRIGEPAQVTPDTIFPLASCSKPFTSTLLAMLVEENRLDWDDHVRRHLDYFKLADPAADANVTIRDLLAHRTGLAPHDELWYRGPFRREELIKRLAFLAPAKSFRSTMQYQSMMYTAAGLLAETVMGQRWETLISKRLLEPLQMKATTFTTAEAIQAADVANPHHQRLDGTVFVLPRWYEYAVPDPAGSINSNARDLGQWLRLQLGQGKLGERQIVATDPFVEQHLPQTIIRFDANAQTLSPDSTYMSYGFGWVIQDHQGEKIISHAGSIDGFRVHITLVPQRKIGWAILANLTHTRMNLALSNSLLEKLLGLKERDWNQYYGRLVEKAKAQEKQTIASRDRQRKLGLKPTLSLKDYVGFYSDPAYGTLEVRAVGMELRLRWGQMDFKLNAFDRDLMTVDDPMLGELPVHFQVRDGSVHSVNFLDRQFARENRP
jgi:CubicO group peptidase (beta-lactamase class C family)